MPDQIVPSQVGELLIGATKNEWLGPQSWGFRRLSRRTLLSAQVAVSPAAPGIREVLAQATLKGAVIIRIRNNSPSAFMKEKK